MYRHSCFSILLFPGLLDLGEMRSANSGPPEANCRGFYFSLISAGRGCHPDCLVLGSISESDSKLNSDMKMIRPVFTL